MVMHFLPPPRRICNCRRLFVCLFVCLFVSNCAKTSERICMKCPQKVGNGPVNKWLNFADDPDHGSGPGYGYPDRDTGKTCLGGGMKCPSASS